MDEYYIGNMLDNNSKYEKINEDNINEYNINEDKNSKKKKIMKSWIIKIINSLKLK